MHDNQHECDDFEASEADRVSERDSERGSASAFAHYIYERFIRLRGKPEEIAWGVAIGFFVAMSPTMGIQTWLVIPVAALLRVSKVAAAGAVWLTNPVTGPFIYGFNYTLGAKLLGYPLKAAFISDPTWATFWHSGGQCVLAMTVGGVLTGIVAGCLGYFVVLGMVKAARAEAARLKRRKGSLELKGEG